MTDELMNFRKYAIQGGITAPLCNEYRTLWRACGNNKDKLAMLAMRQQAIPYFITHCFKNHGLSKEYIMKNFHEYINENKIIHDCDAVKGYDYSLYVGFNAQNTLNTDVSSFMWSNVPLYEIKATKAQILYVGCNSHLTLSLSGYNNITIYLFDTSTITINDMDDTSSMLIYKYSNDCKVDIGKYCTTNNIKQYNKQLIL